jgi:hypothetical protein
MLTDCDLVNNPVRLSCPDVSNYDVDRRGTAAGDGDRDGAFASAFGGLIDELLEEPWFDSLVAILGIAAERAASHETIADTAGTPGLVGRRLETWSVQNP